MLRQDFFSLLHQYTQNAQTVERLWDQVDTAYAAEDRYFHNASHLIQMHLALKEVQAQIDDWNTLLLAVFYHDIVYDVVQYVIENDNEDRSAEEAEKALQTINYPAAKIERCKAHILATKQHQPSADGDTNFLIDADLLVLGQPWEAYKTYMEAIRKEYAVYPDSIYYAGRTHVLKAFLRTERLFKTEHFFRLYEEAARDNMERELEIISLS